MAAAAAAAAAPASLAQLYRAGGGEPRRGEGKGRARGGVRRARNKRRRRAAGTAPLGGPAGRRLPARTRRRRGRTPSGRRARSWNGAGRGGAGQSRAGREGGLGDCLKGQSRLLRLSGPGRGTDWPAPRLQCTLEFFCCYYFVDFLDVIWIMGLLLFASNWFAVRFTGCFHAMLPY